MCMNEGPNKIPEGNYTYVGLDIDTTGRRLIDEIVQIAAYCPNGSFSQYIMPLMNLNPAARQRHQVRVITVGFFRMLKSMQTYKVIKTKTEIATLNEFLEWLEKQNENKDGVVFIYHDQRKFVPYILIEAFKKYNLLDRFLNTVKSFVNGYTLAEEKCANTIKYLSLHQLSKLLLNKTDDITDGATSSDSPSKDSDNQQQQEQQQQHQQQQQYRDDEFEGNASTRAKLAYKIAKHLSMEDQKDLDAEATVIKMNTYISNKALSTDTELNELKEQEENLVRQNSLRSVFLQYFRSALYHRVKAVNYRRLLAEYKHDNDSLTDLWTNGKRDAITEAVNKIESLKDEEREELVEILDCHYDPEKKSLKPAVKRSNSRRRMPRNRPDRRYNKENHRPNRKSRSHSNGHRRFYSNNNNNNNHHTHNNNNNDNNNNVDEITSKMQSLAMKKEYAHQMASQQHEEHNHQIISN